jgi:hypothetical protein
MSSLTEWESSQRGCIVMWHMMPISLRFIFTGLLVFGTLPAVMSASAKAQTSAPTGIEVAEVPLVAWVAARQHALPDTLAGFSETDDLLASFRAFADAMAIRDWVNVRRLAQPISYEIVAISEGDAWFVVASDDSNTGRGPTLVVNANARKDVIIEAPHVPSEAGTGEQAVTLVRDLGGRAALVSGAHRCASRRLTSCDGKNRRLRQARRLSRFRCGT